MRKRQGKQPIAKLTYFSLATSRRKPAQHRLYGEQMLRQEESGCCKSRFRSFTQSTIRCLSGSCRGCGNKGGNELQYVNFSNMPKRDIWRIELRCHGCNFLLNGGLNLIPDFCSSEANRELQREILPISQAEMPNFPCAGCAANIFCTQTISVRTQIGWSIDYIFLRYLVE